MNRKVAVILILQTLLIVILFWVLVFYGKDEYEAYTRESQEEIDSPSRVKQENGATLVVLSAETQAQSDIQTSPLKPGKHQGMLNAYGSVIGIEPLIELRTRYLNARAEAGVVRASVTNSQQEYQRLLQLNQDNRNVSDRAVAAAEAAWKADQARIAVSDTTAANLRDNMRQLWGETLTAQAVEASPGPGLQRLLQYREVLLQVTLPFDAAAPKAGDKVQVSPVGTPGKTVQAEFVSASPQTDTTIQGKTYYFRAAADELRSGMRVAVRLAAGAGKDQEGLVVPGTAIVWYGGKAWVYRKNDTEHFERIAVSTDIESGDGWFNATGKLKAGDSLVTSGAQLLLSEEFKYQIKNENED